MSDLVITPGERIAEHPELHRVVPDEAILEEVDKILSSKLFRNAKAQGKFFRYVVEQSVQGNRDKIKEYTIGVEVFQRKDTFDPRRDNVVRAQARKLRGTLAKYYQGEGLADPVRIDFPVGTYLPVFQLAENCPATENGLAETPLARPERLSTEERPPAGPEEAPRETRWKGNWRLAAVFTVLLVLAAGTFYFLKRTAPAPSGATPSIAVLPFRIINADKEEEYFSDGLTEDLTDSLAQIPGLRVVASSSAFQYKGKDVDVREVGRALSVGVVLEGSVRRFEDRVRITTQLSDAVTGFHLWSASYDRDLKDVLAIQRQISDAITNALGMKLAGSKPGESLANGNGAITNPEAYQDYLKGRYSLAKHTPEGLNAAIDYFNKSIAKDPAYAPAYAGLARCYAAIPVFTTTSKELVRKIKESASKALELDSNLGEPHVDLARAYTYDYQWSKAEQELKKALEVSPGVAGGHQWYGHFLVKTGRLPEALVEYKKALLLDPVSPGANRNVARGLYFMRQYDDAIALFKESLELEPGSGLTHRALGITYVMKGMFSEGMAEMELAPRRMDNSWTIAEPGYAYAVAGKTVAARKILDTLLEQSSQQPSASQPSPALDIAQIYIGLGNKDQAFQWLRRAINEQNVNISLKADPIYDSLRSDPRFTDLLRTVNLLPTD